MEWLITLVTGLGLLVLLAPLLVMLATVFVLVPLAHLGPAPATVARITFTCPFSRRTVSAAFLSAPGADRPADVLSCSLFGAGAIRCQKGCLALATSYGTPSPMVPRYCLIAGGESYRDRGSPELRPDGGSPQTAVPQVA